MSDNHAFLTREVACKFAEWTQREGWKYNSNEEIWEIVYSDLKEHQYEYSKTTPELFSLAESEGVFE